MRELLKPVVTTAEQVAVLVKCLPNIKQAAELIEQYARDAVSLAKNEETAEKRGITINHGATDDC